MDKFLIMKDNDFIIYGSIYNLNNNDLDVKNVIIACHGFGSNRDGDTIKAVAEGNPNSVVISFDWPGHGNSGERLLVKNCIENYELVYDYVIRRFPKAYLYAFGSSFGAYITLQVLKEHPEYDIHKAFFKSPAITMEKSFMILAANEDVTKYVDTPYVTSSGIEVYYEFYEELLSRVITPDNMVRKQEIYIFHGSEDNLVFLKDILLYDNENVHIEVLEGAEHSYRGEYLNRLTQKMREEIGN